MERTITHFLLLIPHTLSNIVKEQLWNQNAQYYCGSGIKKRYIETATEWYQKFFEDSLFAVIDQGKN